MRIVTSLRWLGSWAMVAGSLVPAAAEAQTRVLEEVIVTAQKREESLQDVPVSVSIVPGTRLESAGIEKVEMLQGYVPNLDYSETGISTNIHIRGIGSGVNQGFEQSVGSYVDGIYHGRARQSRSPFMDVERVEVLRGPQSMLFGKNSTAGALNIISRSPTDFFSASVVGVLEPKYGERQLSGFVSGPITDSLRGRLSAQARKLDGHLENTYLNRDEPQRDEWALRGILDWDVTPNLSIWLKTESEEFDVIGRQVEIIEDRPVSNPLSPFNGLTFAQIMLALGEDPSVLDNVQDFRRTSSGDVSDTSRDEHVLKIDYALGDMTLTSISGYTAFELFDDCDCDFSSGRIFRLAQREKFDQFSQEIRLVSPAGDRVQWLGGVYYQKSDLRFWDSLFATDDSVIVTILNATPGLPPGAGSLLGNTSTPRDFSQDTDIVSVFGQASWPLSDRLWFTAGGRWSDESKSGARSLMITDIDGNPLPAATAPYTLALYQAVLNVTEHDLADKRSRNKFMPTLRLEWDTTADILTYFSWSTGFKSGGYDARSNNSPANGGTFLYDDEEASSFEVGAKMRLAGGAAILNLAAFRTGYEDLQVSTFDGTLGFNVRNAGKATIEGLELEGRWSATDRLILSGALGLIDFSYDDYIGQCYYGQIPDAPDGINCDYSGKSSQYVSDVSAVLSAEYDLRMSGGREFRFVVDALYRDDFYLSPNLDPRAIQDGYWKLNAGVEMTVGSGRGAIGLIGRNLTDETTLSYANDVPLAGNTFGAPGFFGFVDPGRTVALQLRLDLGD